MQKFEDLDKRLSLLEQKLDLMMNNHLEHLKQDMDRVQKWQYAITFVVIVELVTILARVI